MAAESENALSFDIIVEPDASGVALAAARVIEREAPAAVSRNRTFDLALSGGSTPAALYRLLSGEEGRSIPWANTRLFWGDERCVPPSDERSNHRLAALTGLLDLPVAEVHRMQGELPAEEGARAYDRLLAGLDAGTTPPTLDLVLLGLGEDGHTASLFPGSTALTETDRWVVPTEPVQGVRRLTVTLPVLAAAGRLLFLVTGRPKAAAVARVLGGADQGLPAARALAAARAVTWIMDEDAARSWKPREGLVKAS